MRGSAETVSGRPKRKRRRWWKRLLAYLSLVFLTLMLGGITFVAVLYYQVAQMMPSVTVIENFQPRQASLIYASDGTQLARIAEEYREPVELAQIPKHLINATIAKEDRRFWQHRGVDWRGTARALWVNLNEGDIRQGGSTLTQQLARNVFLSQRRTFSRKIQEIILAQEIERRLSKERVLELYLNQVYYGNGAYGVKAAARVYFNKPLDKLTVAECALLASLPQRPSAYEPFGNPDEAIRQRNLTLDLMAREGYITPDQRDVAKQEPLRLTRNRPQSRFLAPYFVMDVLRQLEEMYGREFILQGGLKVYTTLHMEMQRAAEQALQSGIRAFANQGVNQGAIVLIDLRTGYVRALVGGVDFRRSQYNNITQGRRQPGSAFKPIVYATAFELGKLTPTSVLSDSPMSMPAGGGKMWRPQNADGKFRGSVSVSRALAASINIPAIRAMQLVGPETVARYARERFGIESPLDPVLPLALGASAVRPIELAEAFSVFATGGNRVEPFLLRKAVDANGVVLVDQKGQIVPSVLSEQSAQWMDEILRTAVVNGTGRAAARIPNARGKTGTTSDYRDAWFVGYTDHYLAVVWVASEHYNSQTGQWEYRPMRRVFGGTVCARIWADLMARVLEIDQRINPPKPAEPVPQTEPTPTPPAETTTPEAPAPSEASPAPETPPTEPAPPPANDTVRAPQPSEPALSPASSNPIETTQSGSARWGSDPTPRTSEGAPRTSTPPPPPLPPPPPPPVETVAVDVCADTGERATDYCPEVVRKRFTRGSEPKRTCRKHRVRDR